MYKWILVVVVTHNGQTHRAEFPYPRYDTPRECRLAGEAHDNMTAVLCKRIIYIIIDRGSNDAKT